MPFRRALLPGRRQHPPRPLACRSELWNSWKRRRRIKEDGELENSGMDRLWQGYPALAWVRSSGSRWARVPGKDGARASSPAASKDPQPDCITGNPLGRNHT